MKRWILCLFLTSLFTDVEAYFRLDKNTYHPNELVSIIYAPGCGTWSDISWTQLNNQIDIQISVPNSWIQCHISPIPISYWNQIPLGSFVAGNYIIEFTFIDPQNVTYHTSRNFSVGPQTQPVPYINNKSMLLLMILIGGIGVRCINKKKAQ